MLLERVLGLETRAETLEPVAASADAINPAWMEARQSLTGLQVDERAAMANTAVLCAVQLLSGVEASLPLPTYRLDGDQPVRAKDHPVYRLLHDQPNRESTSYTFRYAQKANRLTWGNSYAEIEIDQNGQVVALWHLPSWLVTPKRVYKLPGGGLTENPADATPEDRRRGGTILYEVSGTVSGEPSYLYPDQVLHIPGPNFDGLVGYSRIRVAVEAIALGLAVQDWAATIFGSDSAPGGIIKRPAEAPPLSPKGVQNRIAAWEAQHKGIRRAGRVAILQEGEEYSPTRLNPVDAQLVQLFQMSVPQIARIYNLPPHMLADLARATFSNIEQQSLEFVIFSLTPDLVAVEKEMCRKLFLEREKPTHYVEHEVKALLRGDTQARYQAHKTAIESGFETPGEAARIENLPPVPDEQGGNIYRAPLNFMAAAELVRAVRAVMKGETDEADEPPARARREQRAKQGFQARGRLRAVFEPLLRGELERVSAKELGALERELKRLNPVELANWVASYYPETLAPFVDRVVGRQLRAYLQAIAGETAVEVGSELALEDAFLATYTAGFAARYTRSHVAAIRRALKTELTEPGKGLKAVAELAAHWRETSAKNEARWEIVRGDSAAALDIYQRAGIRRKVWIPNAGACPLCQAMAGRTASISEPFLSPGDRLQVDSPDVNDLQATRVILAAPLHDGCSCGVGPA